MGRLPCFKRKKEPKATKGFLTSLGNALRKCYDEPLVRLLIDRPMSKTAHRTTPLERKQSIRSAVASLEKRGHPDLGLIGKILRLVYLGKRDSKVLAQLLLGRSGLSQDIGLYKVAHNSPIHRPEVEEGRVNYLVKYAKKHGCTDLVVIETIFRNIIISSREQQERMLGDFVSKQKKAKKISPKRKASTS